MSSTEKFTFGPDRGEYKPDYRWELVTPARAATDLDTVRDYEQANNTRATRKIYRSRVSKYMRDMRAGQWFGETANPVVYNSPGGRFGPYGPLVMDSGFHRYLAIKQLGELDPGYEGEYMNILVNPRTGSLIPVDTGRRATLGDLFAKNGQRNSAVLGQAAPLYVAWLERRTEIARIKSEHTAWLREHPGKSPAGPMRRLRTRAGTRAFQFLPMGQNRVTHVEAMSLVNEHPELLTAVSTATALLGGSNSRLTFLSPAVVAWLSLALQNDKVSSNTYVSAMGSDIAVLNFFEQVITGPSAYNRTTAAGTSGAEYTRLINPTGNPAYTLHERIRVERDRRSGTNNGLSAPDQIKLVIPAWDSWRQGESLSRIITLGSKTRVATS